MGDQHPTNMLPQRTSRPESVQGNQRENRECRYGRQCKHDFCPFWHRPSWGRRAKAFQEPPQQPDTRRRTESGRRKQWWQLRDCWHGAACWRKATQCPYNHPEQTTGNHTGRGRPSKPCWFGAACRRRQFQCPFDHPGQDNGQHTQAGRTQVAEPKGKGKAGKRMDTRVSGGHSRNPGRGERVNRVPPWGRLKGMKAH